MNRNLILTIILVFVLLSNTFSQCNNPTALGLSCQFAIAFSISEMGRNHAATYNLGFRTVVGISPFRGFFQSSLWLQPIVSSSIVSILYMEDDFSNCDSPKGITMHNNDILICRNLNLGGAHRVPLFFKKCIILS
jgi:hypothetical protein